MIALMCWRYYPFALKAKHVNFLCAFKTYFYLRYRNKVSNFLLFTNLFVTIKYVLKFNA